MYSHEHVAKIQCFFNKYKYILLFFAKNTTLLTYVNQKSKITTYIPILFIENGKIDKKVYKKKRCRHFCRHLNIY